MGLFNYISDTRGEMKHVSWPTRRQVTVFTIAVIIISILTGAYLGAFDYLFQEIVNTFFVDAVPSQVEATTNALDALGVEADVLNEETPNQ